MQLEIKRKDYLRIVGNALNGRFPEVLEAAKTQDKFCYHWANDEGATCTFGHYFRVVLSEDADEVDIRDAFYDSKYENTFLQLHAAQRVCDYVGLRVGFKSERTTIHIID